MNWTAWSCLRCRRLRYTVQWQAQRYGCACQIPDSPGKSQPEVQHPMTAMPLEVMEWRLAQQW